MPTTLRVFGAVDFVRAAATWHQPPGRRAEVDHLSCPASGACSGRRSRSACRPRATDSRPPWSAAHRDRSCGARASGATISFRPRFFLTLVRRTRVASRPVPDSSSCAVLRARQPRRQTPSSPINLDQNAFAQAAVGDAQPVATASPRGSPRGWRSPPARDRPGRRRCRHWPRAAGNPSRAAARPCHRRSSRSIHSPSTRRRS